MNCVEGECLLLPCPSLAGYRYLHISFKELGGSAGVSHSMCCLILSLMHPVHTVATDTAVL